MACTMSADHDPSDEDWSDAEEGDEMMDTSNTLCLFCDETFGLASLALEHMTKIHDFNVTEFYKQRNMDFYSYVKMINYIRTHKTSSESAMTEIDFMGLKDDDKYLRPVYEDDMLLQIDFDTIIKDSEEPMKDASEQFEHKLKNAEDRALQAEQSLARAIQDLNSCKAEMQKLFLAAPDNDTVSADASERTGESVGYFESYAHHGIHEEMLKDNVRTEAYKKFIMSNQDMFKNKIVLDIGCGTGILSMFAAKAGAKLVIAVDQSEIAYHAMAVVKENGLDDVVKVIKGNAEKLVLPDGLKSVDIIISEWMGYFLFFEGMLDTILSCRDKYLSSDGMVYPDVCSVSLAAISDEELWDAKIDFWDDVHGCKMSCMKKYVMREALIDIVPKNKIISMPAEVVKYDVMKTKVEDLEYEADFKLPITKKAICTGIVGYFYIGFEKSLLQPVSFDTSCESLPTHWKQTVFLFEKKLEVEEREVLQCAIQCRKDPKDARSLTVKLHVEKQDKSESIKQMYVLN